MLDSYPYVFKEYAYTSTNDEITYMNYLYMLDDNLYALVLEPINGTKYTKIVIFDDTHEISRDEFKDYIKYYLELTELEFLDESNVVRSGHTSLDVFKDKMDLVIIGSSNLVSNSYFKKKVKDLKEQKCSFFFMKV